MSIFVPSRFADDPLGHAGNQSFHVLFGLGVWLVTESVGWLVTESVGWGWTALPIGVLYFVGWEWGVQRLGLRQPRPERVRLFADSVEDAAHVTFGPVIGMALHHGGPVGALGAFIAWGAVLAFGMWRRW